jgi:hypothetical protein
MTNTPDHLARHTEAVAEVPLQDRLTRIFDDAGGSDTLVDLLAEFDFESSRDLADTIVAAMSGCSAMLPVWQPIETAPRDEEILVAVQVRTTSGLTWWERRVIVIDSETGTISDTDCDHGWRADDYSHWQPLPTPPENNNDH